MKHLVHLAFATATIAGAGSPYRSTEQARAGITDGDTIVPGHVVLRDVTPHLGTDTTDTYAVVNGARRKLNTSIQTVSRTSSGYLVVQVAQAPSGTMIDSTWVDAGTFTTRRHVEVGPGESKTVVFDRRHLTGSRTDSGSTRAVDVMLERDALDNSIGSVIAMGLSLTPGYTVVIGTYDIDGSYNYIKVRYVGPDSVPESGAPAWKVVTEFTSGTRQWSVDHWIDPNTRRDLRWELAIQGRSMLGVAR